MDQQRIIEEFKELVSIEVYSRKERAIADVLKKKLTDLGLTVTEDGAGEILGGDTGNLYAVLPGDPSIEPVLFSAHMDRVANNGHISPVINEEEGIIHSDGKTILAGDDIGGVCAILAMLRTVQEEKIPHGTIEVAFSVCEESGVEGSRQYDFSQFQSKSCFVYDASGRAGTIVVAAPSKGRVTIRVHGRTAHAGNEPEKGLNAVKVAADLIMQLPDSRLSPASTANFSMLQAGSATNVVCDLVTITGEQRSRVAAEYEGISEKIHAAADAISKNTTRPSTWTSRRSTMPSRWKRPPVRACSPQRPAAASASIPSSRKGAAEWTPTTSTNTAFRPWASAPAISNATPAANIRSFRIW